MIFLSDISNVEYLVVPLSGQQLDILCGKVAYHFDVEGFSYLHFRWSLRAKLRDYTGPALIKRLLGFGSPLSLCHSFVRSLNFSCPVLRDSRPTRPRVNIRHCEPQNQHKKLFSRNKRRRICCRTYYLCLPAFAPGFDEISTPHVNNREICVQKFGNAYQQNRETN